MSYEGVTQPQQYHATAQGQVICESPEEPGGRAGMGTKGVVIVPCARQAPFRYHLFTGQGFRLCSSAGSVIALGTSLKPHQGEKHHTKSQLKVPQQTTELLEALVALATPRQQPAEA